MNVTDVAFVSAGAAAVITSIVFDAVAVAAATTAVFLLLKQCPSNVTATKAVVAVTVAVKTAAVTAAAVAAAPSILLQLQLLKWSFKSTLCLNT